MNDFGEMQYIGAAVQVIPVMLIVLVADPYSGLAIRNPMKRIQASTAALVGMVFGLFGEVAGLQALLAGPGSQTVSLVSAGLVALAASTLGPRLAELQWPTSPERARQIVNIALPVAIGSTGLVIATLAAPVWARVAFYIAILLSLVSTIARIIQTRPKQPPARPKRRSPRLTLNRPIPVQTAGRRRRLVRPASYYRRR